MGRRALPTRVHHASPGIACRSVGTSLEPTPVAHASSAVTLTPRDSSEAPVGTSLVPGRVSEQGSLSRSNLRERGTRPPEVRSLPGERGTLPPVQAKLPRLSRSLRGSRGSFARGQRIVRKERASSLSLSSRLGCLSRNSLGGSRTLAPLLRCRPSALPPFPQALRLHVRAVTRMEQEGRKIGRAEAERGRNCRAGRGLVR
jgi:hypothetical protein